MTTLKGLLLFLLSIFCTFSLSAQDMSDHFVTTWKTDNPGTSNSTSIKIPTTGSGYAYDVDWNNDGVFDEFGITGDVTHDFGTAGTYTIRIQGSFPRIYFNNAGDKEKILSVDQWGNQQWTSMGQAFWGCWNMNVVASDSPDFTNVSVATSMFKNCDSLDCDMSDWDVSNVTFMNLMFEGCHQFNSDLSSWAVSNVTRMERMFFTCDQFSSDLSTWNVSNVTAMFQMFWGCDQFDSDLSNWDVSNVTNMYNILSGTALSTSNYDALLAGWSQLDLQDNVSFSAGSTQYCESGAERQQIIDDFGWSIADGGAQPGCGFPPGSSGYFITEWNTSSSGVSNSTSITIPAYAGETYNYDVDWDYDGVFDEFGITGDVTHDFGSPGTYSIIIRGEFPGIHFNDQGDHNKIRSVRNWGDIQWKRMDNAFHDCSFLTIETVDAPDLSQVTSLKRTFMDCDDLTDELGDWDVSSIENLDSTFYSCGDFNADLDSWDVSNVTSMNSTFRYCYDMDQDFGGWDVSNVTDMTYMLSSSGISTANYDTLLTAWSQLDLQANVGFSVGTTQFCNSFTERQQIIVEHDWAIADGGLQDGCDLPIEFPTYFISRWKTDADGTSNSTSITIPTYEGETYNYDVDWNYDGVFDELGITGDVTHDFGSPGTYNIIIRGEFPGIHFNDQGDHDKIRSVLNWGEIEWKRMDNAFHDCSFLTIEALDVPDLSQVTSLEKTFVDCDYLSLTDELGDWDVSSISNMNSTFYSCAGFNPDLSTWDVSNVTDMTAMFSGSWLSTENYDALLIGWSQLQLQNNVVFGVGNSDYCTARVEHEAIIDDFGWNIEDGGLDPECWEFSDDFVIEISPLPGSPWPCEGNYHIISPLGGGAYDVDWDNDGVFDEFGLTGLTCHSYDDQSNKTIRVRGDCDRISFDYTTLGPIPFGYVNIKQWGAAKWESLDFGNCADHLDLQGSDTPDLSQVNNLNSAFSGGFTQNFWDGMYVTGNLNNWDVSNVTSMRQTFAMCSNVPDIDIWDVSNVTDMNRMFYLTQVPLHLIWDVSNVTDMEGMFLGASIGSPIGIENWDVSSVIYMGGMFSGCTNFYADLSDWDVGNVTDMGNMFRDCDNFDRDLGSWDVSNVNDMENMFNNTNSMSTENYDALLTGWSQLDLQPGVDFDAPNFEYCTAADARQSIIDDFGWSIDDNGEDPDCVLPCPTDMTGDGITDINDFLMFNTAFGNACNGCPEDLTGDGVIDINDFLILNTAFGQSCP